MYEMQVNLQGKRSIKSQPIVQADVRLYGRAGVADCVVMGFAFQVISSKP